MGVSRYGNLVMPVHLSSPDQTISVALFDTLLPVLNSFITILACFAHFVKNVALALQNSLPCDSSVGADLNVQLLGPSGLQARKSLMLN
jgi:hypothetical protein